MYNDKFAYSHHATDPACGKLCNSFDLVRIHKFSYLDKDETDSEKSASFKAMTDFAMQDGRVKEQTLTDKEKAVYEGRFPGNFERKYGWVAKVHAPFG